jgi:phospholipid/cholesterol/gamma-HCH transport system substrate-binding protein
MVSVRTKRSIEIAVGLFMLFGLGCLLVLALKVSGLSDFVFEKTYTVLATFDNVGELKPRASVSIAGVKVGQVQSIQLDQTSFKAVVVMQMDAQDSKIPSDSSASILTEGLLGSNYVSLSPGYADTFLKHGDTIENTHPALILENLIGQFLFSIKNASSNTSNSGNSSTNTNSNSNSNGNSKK